MGLLDKFGVTGEPGSGSMFERKLDLSTAIRTTATVERVVVTDTQQVSRATMHHWDQDIYVLFSLVDDHGAPVTCYRELLVQPGWIPPPGSRVPVVYEPGRLNETIDFVRNDQAQPATDLREPPDPTVPRGWSGGVFEVDAMGGGGKFPLSGFGIEADRELFRTGRQVVAKVIAITHANKWVGAANSDAQAQTLTLEVEGRQIEKTAWVPQSCYPKIGSYITVALNADGSELALDTDERWDGSAGRLLIFAPPDPYIQPTLPPGMGPIRGSEPVLPLEQRLANLKDQRLTMGDGYEPAVRQLLDIYQRTRHIDKKRSKELLKEALAD
jgi:hypothetical protein